MESHEPRRSAHSLYSPLLAAQLDLAQMELRSKVRHPGLDDLDGEFSWEELSDYSLRWFIGDSRTVAIDLQFGTQEECWLARLVTPCCVSSFLYEPREDEGWAFTGLCNACQEMTPYDTTSITVSARLFPGCGHTVATWFPGDRDLFTQIMFEELLEYGLLEIVDNMGGSSSLPKMSLEKAMEVLAERLKDLPFTTLVA